MYGLKRWMELFLPVWNTINSTTLAQAPCSRPAATAAKARRMPNSFAGSSSRSSSNSPSDMQLHNVESLPLGSDRQIQNQSKSAV